MRLLVFVLLFTISNLAFAAKHFVKNGEVDSFTWNIERYNNSAFSYDVFYYIPKSIH